VAVGPLMPRCIRCGHEFAAHVKFGPVIGVYSCRDESCDCIAYVARSAHLANLSKHHLQIAS
jgi:hypothetical protein